MKPNLIIKPRATDYILGVNSPIEFKAVSNGDWTLHLWFQELQRNPNFETDGCVCWTAQEVFDAEMDVLWPTLSPTIQSQITAMGYLDTGTDGQKHFHSSPRFVEIMTGNGTNGNSIPDAWDAMRKYGVLPFTDLPFDQTMTETEYFAPVPQNLMDKATQFLALMGGKNSIQYHWITDNATKNVSLMQSAILQAPLCIGVAVAENWNQTIPNPDPSPSAPPEHAVMVYKMTAPSTDIYDHYLPYFKVLDADYPINYVLQAVVTINTPIQAAPTPLPPAPIAPLSPTPSVSQFSVWLTELASWLQEIFQPQETGITVDISKIESNIKPMSKPMSPILKQGLLKALYGAVGVFLAAIIPFLNANTAVLGSWTVGVIFILTMVEEYFFPSNPQSTPPAPPAAS